MTSWNWKSCIVGAILAASVLASTSAQAQPVSPTEAGVAIKRSERIRERIDWYLRAGKGHAYHYFRKELCRYISNQKDELAELKAVADRAVASQQHDLAWRLLEAYIRLKARLSSTWEDYCGPPPWTLPGGGGAGGGGGGGAAGGSGGGAGGEVRSSWGHGFWLGVEFSEERLKLNWSRSQQINPFNPFANDNLPNSGSATKDPLGGGVAFGYAFSPWSNVQISPFVSVDYLNMSVAQTFPGGSSVGATSNFAATFGVKAGPQLPVGLWLYGIAGASVLNEKLNVAIAPLASSTTATVPGATVGFGGALQPSFLQGFGHPVSLFVEYQHTWWQSANFNTPAASPLFNYNFARHDDVVKFGFTVSLNPPPAAPAPIYPVKALPSK